MIDEMEKAYWDAIRCAAECPKDGGAFVEIQRWEWDMPTCTIEPSGDFTADMLKILRAPINSRYEDVHLTLHFIVYERYQSHKYSCTWYNPVWNSNFPVFDLGYRQ